MQYNDFCYSSLGYFVREEREYMTNSCEESRNFQNSCKNCRLFKLCFPYKLNQDELMEFDLIVNKNRVLRKQEILFKENKPFSSLFVVRSGYIKTFQSSGLSARKVTGFYIAGEILGLDAIYPERYQTTAVTLDDVSVCEIPFERLISLASKTYNLQKQIMRLISEKIIYRYNGQERITSAEKRLVVFLFNLSERLKRAGMSYTHFILPASKKDISDYLGIALETMSRTLAKLNDYKVINFNKKEVTLKNTRELQEMINDS